MDLMERLCRARGVSGFEGEVVDILRSEFEKSCDTVYEDDFGNLIAKKGSGNKKIMLAAHMDEIGMMVKHVTEDGYIHFIKIGGIDNRILLNQRVVIKGAKGDVVGIVGAKPPHLLKPEERKKVVKHDEMFIDIGAKSKKDAFKKIAVGDSISFEPNYGKLANNLYYGKAVDDRIGCYVLAQVMKQIPKSVKAEVYAVGTTQEEVGLKGARVAAYGIDPDYALAVDTTIAGDMPDVSDKESSLKLGKGPALTIMEASGRGVITHPKLRKVLEATAKSSKTPYQIDVLEGGMTDAAIIYLTRDGIPSSTISIPTRYIHGPTSIFHMKDVSNSVKLVKAALPGIASLK